MNTLIVKYNDNDMKIEAKEAFGADDIGGLLAASAVSLSQTLGLDKGQVFEAMKQVMEANK